MKHVKKIASLLLALVMVFAMSATAFAANVTLPGENTILKGHSFTAYQIFSGEKATVDGKVILSNVEWGGGIDETFLTTLKASADADLQVPKTDDPSAKVNAFTECETAADVAEVLGKHSAYDNAFAKAVAKIAYEHKKGNGTQLHSGDNDLADGYYLIVDSTDNDGMAEGQAYNAALLQVVGSVDVTVKTDVPHVEKKVKDTNDSAANSTTDWQDSADYDIGDTVPFQLKATLPNNVSSYDTYKLIFNDTISKGLTYVKGQTPVIKIGDNAVTDASKYSVKVTENVNEENTLTITFNDIKTIGGTNNSVVTVEYNAKLNEHAVIGSAGNPNTVHLEYSNNPNSDGEGDMNKTPDDKVIVFTYKVVVNKIDENEKPLVGAGFTLQKKNAKGTYVNVGEEIKGNQMTKFTWSGLDDGDYQLVETTTPEGYNTIDPIQFTVSAGHDIESDNPALSKLSGKVTTGEITFTGNDLEGSLSTSVVNHSGTILPETGGIGTTIFYVVGAILMIGAGVMLVTRKRISK